MKTATHALILSMAVAVFVFFPGCSGKVRGVSGVDGGVPPDGGEAGRDGWVEQDGAATGDNAEFVSQNVPGSVAAGGAFQATFTMRNTGSTAWSESALYRLGSWNPQDDDTWGTGRIQMEATASALPADTYTFTANLTAPATPGSYTMQWRMVHEFVNWFGDPSAELTIQVEDLCFDHCNNQQMDCGEIYVDCGGLDCAPCQPVELATLDASGSYPRVAVASPDKVMVVWQPNIPNSGDNRMRWSCFDGAGWTAPARATPGSGIEGYSWIVPDGQQRFHLVYSNGLGDDRYTHYSRFDAAGCAGQWRDPAEVLPRALPFSVTYPSVGVDENDRPYVTFSQSLAAKPSPTYPVCTTNSDCDPDYHCYPGPGNCHPDYAQFFARRTGGAWGSGNWTGPVRMANGLSGKVSHHGAIFVWDSSMAHAVWLQAYPGLEIFYSQYNGSVWSAPESTGITSCHAADVQSDGNDVFVFTDTARFVERPVSSGSWSAIANVGSGGVEINLIRMRVDAAGQLHAVWNASGFRIMYAMTDSNGNWLAPKAVSPAAEQGHEPWIDVDGDGNVHIVWAQCTPPGCTGGEYGSVWYLKTRYVELP